MKKKELCRSIESIKQENELKERILKGVEEKDRITVIRRPLFIPVIAALVCLNVGMAAKLVIFNKSQVNMSELKARTSMSAASDDSDIDSMIEEQEKLVEEMQKEQEDLHNQMDEMRKEQDIQNHIKEIQKDLEKPSSDDSYAQEVFQRFMMDVNNGYCMTYEEWRCSEDFVPNMTTPYYYTIPSNTISPVGTTGEYTVRRYVQTIPFFTYGEENTAADLVHTNHEYIVVYKGECELKNIVSITESNADSLCVDKEALQESYYNFEHAEEEDTDKFYEKIEALGKRYINQIESETDTHYDYYYYSKLDTFLMYPQKDENSDPKFIHRCYVSALSSSETKEDYDPLEDTDVLRFFFIDDEGNEITDMYMTSSSTKNGVMISTDVRFGSENYWKDTVYVSNELLKEKVEVPDIIGMSVEEAEQALIEAGLKVSSKSYAEAELYNPDAEFNDVINFYPVSGSIVDKGEEVSIVLCGKSIPYLAGEDVDTAEKRLREMGYEVKYEYLDGTKPGDSGLCVLFNDPCGLDADAAEVTLYITERDRTQYN